MQILKFIQNYIVLTYNDAEKLTCTESSRVLVDLTFLFLTKLSILLAEIPNSKENIVEDTVSKLIGQV